MLYRTEGLITLNESHQTRAQQLIGDFAPKLVDLTDNVLFGDIWERAELSPRDRSPVTVASLVTGGSPEQLRGHLVRVKTNGLEYRVIEHARALTV
jgi:4-carboxymuconolactone decarboxylase